MSRRLLLAIVAVLVLVSSYEKARAMEIITLRTGQWQGARGTCVAGPDRLDDQWMCYSNQVPNVPLPGTGPNGTFSAGDFQLARTTQRAIVVNPNAGWVNQLTWDNQAQWISWKRIEGCFGDPASTLYACPFNVTTQYCPVADITIAWAADDCLGDPPGNGANQIGVYVNEVPLDAGFSGGGFGGTTVHTQSGVSLHPGQNWIYVYQRDLQHHYSGIMMYVGMAINPGLPHISGYKFSDLNCNGVRETGEPGLSSWTINLAGPVTGTTTTDASGYYQFNCLTPGNYQVFETSQPGYVVSTPPNGVGNIFLQSNHEACDLGNCPCQWSDSACVRLPRCLTAYYPFDEGSGTLARDLAAGRNGTLARVGGAPPPPNWVLGHTGSPPSALNFPASPVSFVGVLDKPENQFGTGSFAIVAWIRTSASDAAFHSIVDKSNFGWLNPGYGYQFGLIGGQLRLRFGSPWGGSSSFTSNGPTLNDGRWHLVAALVCRDPAQVILYSDLGVRYFGPPMDMGNVDSGDALTIGASGPDFNGNRSAFSGDIDELSLYNCCLNIDDLIPLWSGRYCKEWCYAPYVTNFCNSPVTINFNIFNATSQFHNYAWTVAPIGGTCVMPTSVLPYAGTLGVNAFTTMPGMGTGSFTVTLPASMVNGAYSCFQISIIDKETGECLTCSTMLVKSCRGGGTADPGLRRMSTGAPQLVRFPVRNLTGSVYVSSYTVLGRSADGDANNQIVSLNGLPPGTPVNGIIQIPAGATQYVEVTANLTSFEALTTQEVVLSLNADDDPALEDWSVVGLQGITDIAVANVTDPSVGHDLGVPPEGLVTAPNPFRDRMTLLFDLPKPEAALDVEVFDVAGRLVRNVFAGPLGAGNQRAVWDGRDANGRPVPRGIYLVRIHGAGINRSKMIVRVE
jgi:hypothetical protein